MYRLYGVLDTLRLKNLLVVWWLQGTVKRAAKNEQKRKKLCNLICCKPGSKFFARTRYIALQLVLQQSFKTSCTFFVARFCCSLNKWCSECKYSYLIFSREMRSIFFLQLRGLFRQGLQCKGKEFYCELSRSNLGSPVLGSDATTAGGANYWGPVTVPLPIRDRSPHGGVRLPLYEQRVGSLMSFRVFTCRGCETWTTVYRPYPRRLESLTVCRCLFKGNTFSPVILKTLRVGSSGVWTSGLPPGRPVLIR